MEDAKIDQVATWASLFIGVGLDLGLTPDQMIIMLKPENIIEIAAIVKIGDIKDKSRRAGSESI